jgi:hypothetical protein
VEYVSLGAGNTGKAFDLETNFRVAEFKFIKWRGHDAVRQDSVFKDFVLLAESETKKRKYLYLFGTDHALKFLNGGRSLKSVLNRSQTAKDRLTERFGNNLTTVRDYYSASRDKVMIEDVSPWLGELAEDPIAKEP